ncbi:hypothetical protein BPNPMPFG_003628 [Mesorhizobium sp. AR07]|uniref:hypothetical protein n=1 Tax=Mesorhizobium sp. AR07 TaxID=2865838 RepID=UPI00215F7495|nr:hypothetical protein [Mesorhizobium sp. AR07]UVK41998.1 hypothetical protein BPNPMPFG_003628 [Mesorhizobium sp. AR07]
MLAIDRLDAVDIVARHDTHTRALRAGDSKASPTIVQKPFAPTWEETASNIMRFHCENW